MAKLSTFTLLAILAVFPLALGEGSDEHFFFSIQSHYEPTETDRCVDVEDGNIVVADCEAGKESQLWYAKDTVIMHYSGACMEVCDGPGCTQYVKPLNQVIASECSEEENQQFKTSGRRLVSVYNGHCLDVCKGLFCKPQNDVITFPCHVGDNQKWDLILGGYTGPPSDSISEASIS